jgi:hypothetical protein
MDLDCTCRGETYCDQGTVNTCLYPKVEGTSRMQVDKLERSPPTTLDACEIITRSSSSANLIQRSSWIPCLLTLR